jgi:hypothetical protein
MKRPSFQFYPLEFLGDLELHSCSPAARGIWADMLCLAHHPDRYGHLTINGKPMTDTQIINRIQGATKKLMTELEEANVFSRAEDGAIYSRRMVRDEATRNARAEGGELGAEHGPKGAEHGAKGGRPSKQTGGKEPPLKPPLTVETEPPIKPPPASASAFASSPSNPGRSKATVAPPALPGWLPAELWAEWRRHRGKKLTAEAEKRQLATLDRLRQQGHDPPQVIARSIERGWSGLFPLDKNGGQQAANRATVAEEIFNVRADDEPTDITAESQRVG